MRLLKIAVLLLLPLVGFSQLRGKVVAIADGDTFTMMVGKKKIKVRLYGVDCPEKGQPYGEEAKKYLIRLVKLHHDSIQVIEKGRDRYGRMVGIVYIGGINLNENLLAHGMAWHYHKYDKNIKWSSMQTSAKKAKAHLWSQKNPIPPWEWRKKGK